MRLVPLFALWATLAVALPPGFEVEHGTPATVRFPNEVDSRTGRLVVAVPEGIGTGWGSRWRLALHRQVFFEEAVGDQWVDHPIPWDCQLKVRELLAAYTLVRVPTADGVDFGVLEHLSFTLSRPSGPFVPEYAGIHDILNATGRFELISHPDRKIAVFPLEDVEPYRARGRSCGSKLLFWSWFR